MRVRSVTALGFALVLGSRAYAQDRSPELLTALQLRANQQAAYAAYLKATAPDAAAEARRATEGARLGQMTTPQRFDWTRAQLAADLATMDAEGPAVKRFYDQLSPAQQHTFDAMTAPPPTP